MTTNKQTEIQRLACETRIEALIMASEVTIHEPTRLELARRINRLNTYYIERYGKTYIPQKPQNVPYFVGSLDFDTIRRLNL